MKCAIVTVKDSEGSYKSLYSGSDFCEARRVYKANAANKDYLEIFLHEQHVRRRISTRGHEVRNEAKKEAPKKKKGRKPEKED